MGTPPDVRVPHQGAGGGTGTRAVRLVFGPPRVRRLAYAHGFAACGDTFVTVSLAGSLFFNVSPDASRQQVLLYLIITMTPLAVLAPLVGPAVDRFRSSQPFVAATAYALRGVICIALAATLFQLSFYAFALALLVVSKASGVVRQALVPALVDEPTLLVSTNARMTRLSAGVGALSAGGAALILDTWGAPWVLRGAAIAFGCAAILATRVRPRPAGLSVHSDVEYAEMHLPTVVVASVGFMAIRAAVGFFVFTMAFTFRRASEPAWVYGLAVVLYGAGGFSGNVLAPIVRRRFSEEQLIALAMVIPTLLTGVGMLGVSRPLLMAIAVMIGMSTTLGGHAFDSLLQQRAPAALLGRASARYETRFQLAWVLGGVLATPISLPAAGSMAVLAAMYVPALVLFVRAARAARRFEATSMNVLPSALARLASAEQSLRNGAARAAIVDAVAAVDLAQTADGGIAARAERPELDALRALAIDTARDVTEESAHQAIELARRVLTSALP